MPKKRQSQKPFSEKDDIVFAASASDCTGLIPTPPVNAAELEAYNTLYPIYPTPDAALTHGGDTKNA